MSTNNPENKQADTPNLTDLNLIEQKTSTLDDIPKPLWIGIIIAVIVIIGLATSDGKSSECEKKATVAGQWNSVLYHSCMKTPKGFRW